MSQSYTNADRHALRLRCKFIGYGFEFHYRYYRELFIIRGVGLKGIYEK